MQGSLNLLYTNFSPKDDEIVNLGLSHVTIEYSLMYLYNHMIDIISMGNETVLLL